MQKTTTKTRGYQHMMAHASQEKVKEPLESQSANIDDDPEQNTRSGDSDSDSDRLGAQQVSLWKDVKHDMYLNKRLIPGYLMVSVLVIALFVLRRFVRQKVQVQVYISLLLWMGTTGYVMAFLTLSAKYLNRVQQVILLAQPLVVSIGLVFGLGGYLVNRGFISELSVVSLGPALACGVLTWLASYLISKMETACSQFFVGFYAVPPAILGTFMSYGYFSFVLVSDLEPMIEILIGGVGYPLAVAIVGKVMLCDFAAYLIHFACKINYTDAVDFMVGFMRILFFMNLQAAVFMLDSFSSFVLALLSNMMIELLFLPFNVKVATLDNFKRILQHRRVKVAPNKKPRNKRSKSIVQKWFSFDRLPPGIRFGRHYYNEAIAEKVSLIGVIVTGFTLHLGADESRILELIGRSLVLILFEFMEDLSKRRLLFYLLNVNMMGIEMNIEWKTNLKLSGFVAMSVSFLLIGETLANLLL